jgi:cell wall assembly regulator SMI1
MTGSNERSGEWGMLPALIERVARWLAANRPDYYARLRPGATEARLDTFEAQFSLSLPAPFREFYRWRDGQDPECLASLQENRMFASLDQVADTKEMLDGMIGSDFEDPRWWRRGWIPNLANGGGDHFCLDLTAQDGGTPGQIIAFWHDRENRAVKFSSFEAWFRQPADSMEAGTLKLA